MCFPSFIPKHEPNDRPGQFVKKAPAPLARTGVSRMMAAHSRTAGASMTFHAIDIHTHIVPAEFPAYAGKHGGAHWPHMQPAHDCHHKNVIIDGKNFRTVTDECWDIERRLEAMAAMGIARQVLSPMPELLSYWLPLDDALPLTRHVNDTIAAMVARAPDRFIGLGGIPMQDPDAAAASWSG